MAARPAAIFLGRIEAALGRNVCVSKKVRFLYVVRVWFVQGKRE